jgi:hypothetical protein
MSWMSRNNNPLLREQSTKRRVIGILAAVVVAVVLAKMVPHTDTATTPATQPVQRSPSAAYAQDVPPGQDQMRVLLNVIFAYQMGSDDACPRFKVIMSEVKKELDAVGVDSNDPVFKKIFPVVLDTIRNEDRSKLCREAWEKYVPNGTYKRQMLEAK